MSYSGVVHRPLVGACVMALSYVAIIHFSAERRDDRCVGVGSKGQKREIQQLPFVGEEERLCGNFDI